MFFSSIAHELRTPLNSIINMSNNLKQFILNQKGFKLLKLITNSSKHLSNIIEDALDLSRIENNKFNINLDLFNVREAI